MKSLLLIICSQFGSGGYSGVRESSGAEGEASLIGVAGVPGVSIVVLLTTLGAMGLPAQGLALIIGVDRLLDMVRTCVNVIGNALSAVVISKWEKVYDKEQGKKYLESI